MATQIYCDTCAENDKYLPAVQYCCDCEERICEECVKDHTRIKALRSHHLIDLTSTENKIPTLTKKYCNIHPDTLLDFYCTQHDIPCCRTCIPINHRGCDNVRPLDVVSKDVKTSSLLFDTIEDIDYLIETVRMLFENRDANLKSLAQSKSFIKQQISSVKLRLLKQIDDIEQNLYTQLSTLEEKNEIKIKNQRIEISKLESRLTKIKQEFEFLKTHGSENHTFLALRQLVIDNKEIETDIQRLVSSLEEISVKFKDVSELTIPTIGSIDETTKPCTFQYKPPKVSHAQIKQDVVKPLTSFEKIGQINLKSGKSYNITDIAITADNKLLLSNYHPTCPKVYIYRDCKDYENEIQCSGSPYGITVIPDTDTAIVTLPNEKSIQFINTTNMTKGDKVQVGFRSYGITTTKDNVFIAGYGVVHILDRKGTKIKEVTVKYGSYIYSVHYDKVNDRLLCRYNGGMCCVTLDNKTVYQYEVSGESGLVVEQQGHVYLSHKPLKIHRLSSDGKFRDIVLSKDHGIDYPSALLFNNNFTRLFVVNALKSVSVFNCK